MKSRIFFIFLLFLTVPPVFASDPTIGADLGAYEPPIGTACDVNVPSQYSTIQAGIDAAGWGDTVCVGSGSYSENLLINKTLRLAGSGYDNTILNVHGPESSIIVRQANIIIEGFLIRGTATPNRNTIIEILLNDLTYGVTIRNNWLIASNGGMVVQVDHSQHNDLIQNNIIEGDNSPYLIREFGPLDSDRVNILNNTFIGTVNPNERADTGIVLDASVFSSVISQNSFQVTGALIQLIGPNGDTIINENNFHSVVIRKVGNGWPSSTVNAGNNWWGDTDPSDNIHGSVDYSNFRLSPFPEYPIPPNLPPSVNDAPVLTSTNSTATANEGQTATSTGTVSDADGDVVTLTASIGTVVNNGNGTWSWSFPTTDGPTQSQSVTISGNDGHGGTTSTTFNLGVNNIAPTVSSVSSTIEPTPINTSICASGSFSDPSIADTYTANWNWGDSQVSNQNIGAGIGSFTVNACHTYTLPGVYEITLGITDDDGGSNSKTFQYVVIYDPFNGHATGNGEIQSPMGAYVANPNATGKAKLGVVAKYQSGATVPTGNTKFDLNEANIDFRSTAYEWMVVNGGFMQLKGSGKINGSGNYGFMVTAIDGQVNGNSSDKFRIKIWDKLTNAVIYDNQMGAPDNSLPITILSKGKITIHAN